jgi:hypothetical protein
VVSPWVASSRIEARIGRGGEHRRVRTRGG